MVNIGSKLVRLDAVAASNCTAPDLPRTNWLGHSSVGQVIGFPLRLQTHSSYRGTFTRLLADGKSVPSGRYRFVLSALKLFGDSQNPEDREKVVLDPFILVHIEVRKMHIEFLESRGCTGADLLVRNLKGVKVMASTLFLEISS